MAHCLDATQPQEGVMVDQEEFSTVIWELVRALQLWGRVRMGRAEEGGQGNWSMALGMGSVLSWCFSVCLEQTELINNSRGTDKPLNMAPEGTSKDAAGWSRTS